MKRKVEKVIRECAAMARNLSPHGNLAEKSILEHYGLTLKNDNQNGEDE
jgi:hypothetical protein